MVSHISDLPYFQIFDGGMRREDNLHIRTRRREYLLCGTNDCSACLYYMFHYDDKPEEPVLIGGILWEDGWTCIQ